MDSGPPNESESAALRESEARYRRIVELAHEGIWTVDRDGRTNFVNQRLCEMLGYTEAEMLGRPMTSFMDPAARAEAVPLLIQSQQGLRTQLDFRFRTKDGSDLWAIISATSIFDDQGKLLDENYVRRVDKFLDELIWMSRVLRHGRENVAPV